MHEGINDDEMDLNIRQQKETRWKYCRWDLIRTNEVV